MAGPAVVWAVGAAIIAAVAAGHPGAFNPVGVIVLWSMAVGALAD